MMPEVNPEGNTVLPEELLEQFFSLSNQKKKKKKNWEQILMCYSEIWAEICD